MFRFDRNKMKDNQPVGIGSFGRIYPYGNDEKWVVKMIDCKNEQEFFHAISEAVLGFNLDHPSILPVEGYSINSYGDRSRGQMGWVVFLKLQRMKRDLQNVLDEMKRNRQKMEKEDMISCFYDIVSGLEYLTKKIIVHRDLKPQNILIDKEGRLRISDIGLANFVSESSENNQMSQNSGTQKYKAPELESRGNIKKKELFQADIWSLGMILLELCLLAPKFDPTDRSLTENERKYALRDDLDEVEARVGQNMSELLERYMLNKDPSQRKSAEEIRKFLEEHYSDILVKKGKIQKSSVQRLDLPAQMNYYHPEFQRNGNEQSQLEDEEEKIERIPVPLSVSEQRSVNDDEEGEDSLLTVSREMQARWHSYFIFAKEASNELKINSLLREDEREKPSCLAGDDETVQMLRELSASLTRNDGFKDLIDFSLDLKNCYNITDNGVSQIGRELGASFSSIENLQIKFSGTLQEKNRQISNLGVEGFSRNIFQRMTNLRQLTVHFEYCERVANAGLKTLVYEITKNNRKLESLHLHFVCCNMITKEAFAEAARMIKEKLGNLQSLTLDFYYCKQIPADIKTGVRAILNNVKKVIIN